MDGIQIINPLAYRSWDELVLSSPNGSFFHTACWARVLAETYKYTPLFFAVVRSGALAALVPCMEVRSAITGARGVSMPFTDYCQPICGGGINLWELFEEIIHYGEKSGWKYIELRPAASLPDTFKPSSSFFGHLLDLSQEEEDIYAAFRDSTKRNIKRAQKSNIKIAVSNAASSVDEFYRLNCMTRKEHGLPPQPFRFFKKIHEHVIAKGHGIAVLASHDGRPVAGAIYFHAGKNAIYKYGASDQRYQHFRANNLVMWQAISWYRRRGYETLHLGRTEPENSGLLQFKRGWNTREHSIPYYKYDLRRQTFAADTLSAVNPANRYFRKMPIPLLRMAGSMLYRHIA